MRRCFYHTDLGQNAVFHNFETQIQDFLKTFRSIKARTFFARQIIELTTL